MSILSRLGSHGPMFRKEGKFWLPRAEPRLGAGPAAEDRLREQPGSFPDENTRTNDDIFEPVQNILHEVKAQHP